MTARRRVVVVGAGAFGSAAALELHARGWAVTLVERGRRPHPDASSTDVSKVVRMDYGSDVFYHELADASMDGWERWNAEWPRPLYHDDGFLVLAPTAMEPGGYEHESYTVLRRRGHAPRRMDGEILSRRYPAWEGSRYPDGYLSPRGGWAESEAVVARLLHLCDIAGVDRVDGTFLELSERGSRVTGVRVRPSRGGAVEALEADRVIIAAGAWTPTLLPSTQDILTTVAQPVLHFGVDDPDTWRPPRFLPFAADIAGSGWYGFPALPDGRLKLGHHGPGRVVRPDDRGEVSADHVRLARRFLAESLPGLADAPVVGSRVCLYCDTRDGDLLIDRAPEREGLVVASGGSGHAFKFTPMLGEIIADAVEGRPSRWLERFGWRMVEDVTGEEARLRIDEHPQPGDSP